MIFLFAVMALMLTIFGVGKFLLYLVVGTGMGIGSVAKKIQGETRFFDTSKNFDEWYNENKDDLDNAMTMSRTTRMVVEDPKVPEENLRKMLKTLYNEQQYKDKQQRQWEEICERNNWKKN